MNIFLRTTATKNIQVRVEVGETTVIDAICKGA